MKNKALIGGIVTVAILIAGVFLFSNKNVSRETFSTITQDMPEARATQMVELNNGDTYNLIASIVKKEIGNTEVKMLAYNGMIPGPLLKVSQGAEITLNFKNE